MNAGRTLPYIFWLVEDTFRQSMASGICWLLLGLSTMCILVCLSVSVNGRQRVGAGGRENADFLPRFDQEAQEAHKLKQSGVAVADGTLRLAFGAVRVAVARDCPGAVHFLQVDPGGRSGRHPGPAADARLDGRLPARLPRRRGDGRAVGQAGAALDVLLGKYVGVLAFVSAQATYFVGGTWLALALRTGVWDAAYLLSIPLLLLQFAIFFGFSLLVGRLLPQHGGLRVRLDCLLGHLLGDQLRPPRHRVHLRPDHARLVLRARVLVGRHRLLAVSQAGGSGPSGLRRSGRAATSAGPLAGGAGVSLWLSVLTSLLFTGYVLFAAGKQFARTDY